MRVAFNIKISQVFPFDSFRLRFTGICIVVNLN